MPEFLERPKIPEKGGEILSPRQQKMIKTEQNLLSKKELPKKPSFKTRVLAGALTFLFLLGAGVKKVSAGEVGPHLKNLGAETISTVLEGWGEQSELKREHKLEEQEFKNDYAEYEREKEQSCWQDLSNVLNEWKEIKGKEFDVSLVWQKEKAKIEQEYQQAKQELMQRNPTPEEKNAFKERWFGKNGRRQEFLKNWKNTIRPRLEKQRKEFETTTNKNREDLRTFFFEHFRNSNLGEERNLFLSFVKELEKLYPELAESEIFQQWVEKWKTEWENFDSEWIQEYQNLKNRQKIEKGYTKAQTQEQHQWNIIRAAEGIVNEVIYNK